MRTLPSHLCGYVCALAILLVLKHTASSAFAIDLPLNQHPSALSLREWIRIMEETQPNGASAIALTCDRRLYTMVSITPDGHLLVDMHRPYDDGPGPNEPKASTRQALTFYTPDGTKLSPTSDLHDGVSRVHLKFWSGLEYDTDWRVSRSVNKLPPATEVPIVLTQFAVTLTYWSSDNKKVKEEVCIHHFWVDRKSRHCVSFSGSLHEGEDIATMANTNRPLLPVHRFKDGIVPARFMVMSSAPQKVESSATNPLPPSCNEATWTGLGTLIGVIGTLMTVKFLGKKKRAI